MRLLFCILATSLCISCACSVSRSYLDEDPVIGQELYDSGEFPEIDTKDLTVED